MRRLGLATALLPWVAGASLLVLVPAAAPAATQPNAETRVRTAETQLGGLLSVVDDTGERRDGLPVVTDSERADAVAETLDQGVPLRLLRIYADVRRWLGRPARPVTVVLGDQAPPHADAGLVEGEDLRKRAQYLALDADLVGSTGYGALDQAFVVGVVDLLVREVSGPVPWAPEVITARAGTSVGAQTDRVTALRRGLGWALQGIDVEDGAARSTEGDPDPAQAAAAEGDATRMLARYRAELVARVALAPPLRTTFRWWHPAVDAQQQYAATVSDLYGRVPAMPDRLLDGHHTWTAMLLDSVVPGVESDDPRPAAQLVARPAALSALLRAWLSDRTLQAPVSSAKYRSAFGASPREPVDNALLKMLWVLRRSGAQDLPELVRAYQATFPGEAPALSRIVKDGLLGQELPRGGALWVSSPTVTTGATVREQYAGSTPLTFDLNAATLPELVAVAHLSPKVARRVQEAAPYSSLKDVGQVKGVGKGALAEFKELERPAKVDASSGPRAAAALPVSEGVLRVVLALLFSALAGALLCWLVTQWRGLGAAVLGAAVGLAALLLAWAGPASGLVGWPGAPPVALGLGVAVLAGVLTLVRRRSVGKALVAAAGFGLPVLPVVLMVTPW